MEKDIFPIIRTVVERERTYIRTLEKDTPIKCVMCGHEFKANNHNAHIAHDGMQMIDCPACKAHVSCLYYLDQAKDKKPAKLHSHSRRNSRLVKEAVKTR